MVAVGCLLLVILPLIGLVGGGWAAGREGAAWGAGAGFALALLACGVALRALVKATRRP